MNVRTIPQNELSKTVGYVHKSLGYMGKDDDAEVNIKQFAHGEASFTCTGCHKTFETNAYLHKEICPNRSNYQCTFKSI